MTNLFKNALNLKLVKCIMISVGFIFISHCLTAQTMSGQWPAILYAPPNKSPYKWFRNGTVISGATNNVYTVTQNGTYYSTFGDCVAGAGSTVPIIMTQGVSTDLSVAISPITRTTAKGETQSFVVTVSNIGPTAASNASVRVTIPDGRSHLGHNASQGAYTPAISIWEVGSLAIGASATLTIDVAIN